MPVFYILIIIILVSLFFLLSFIYKPIGKLFGRVYKDAETIIKSEDEVDKDKKEKEN